MEIEFNFDDFFYQKISISITQKEFMKYIPIISDDIKKLITNYLINKQDYCCGINSTKYYIQNYRYNSNDDKYYIINIPIEKNILKYGETLNTYQIEIYKHKHDFGYTIYTKNHSPLKIYFGKLIKTRYRGKKQIIGKRKFANICLIIDDKLTIRQGYGGKQYNIW